MIRNLKLRENLTKKGYRNLRHRWQDQVCTFTNVSSLGIRIRCNSICIAQASWDEPGTKTHGSITLMDLTSPAASDKISPKKLGSAVEQLSG